MRNFQPDTYVSDGRNHAWHADTANRQMPCLLTADRGSVVKTSAPMCCKGPHVGKLQLEMHHIVQDRHRKTATRRSAPGQHPAFASAAAHGGGGSAARRLHVAQDVHRVAQVAVQLRHGVALVLQLQLPAPQQGITF